jgi:hypothetical protein
MFRGTFALQTGSHILSFSDLTNQPNQAMTPIPQTPNLQSPPALHAPAKPALSRDVLWGRPLFKAPALPSPRINFDPLPFSSTRVTHRPRTSS